jgi:hypothetical protein
MRATSPFVFMAIVATTLVAASQIDAQPNELNDGPPPHAIPSPEAQAAVDQASEGNMNAGVEAMRSLARESAENSFYLGILLYSWRAELAYRGIDPLPPVDWEMDWIRCSAMMGKTENRGPLPAPVLAEYYFNDDLSAKRRPSSPEFHLPGPGKSLALSRCWSGVSEGTVTAKSCIAQEQDWRGKRKLPAFTCPPAEPTSAEIAKYPAVKILD